MFFLTLLVMIDVYILLSSRFLQKFYIFLKKIFEAANQAVKHSSNYMNLSHIRQKNFVCLTVYCDIVRKDDCSVSMSCTVCIIHIIYCACASHVYPARPTEAVETLYYRK